MLFNRPGVHCSACGQPIVLQDVEPKRLAGIFRAGSTIRLLCISCGHAGEYFLSQFGNYASEELASGDWEPVVFRRTRSARVGRRE